MCLFDWRMGRTSTDLGAYIQVKGQQRDGTHIHWPHSAMPGGGLIDTHVHTHVPTSNEA